MRKFLIFAVMAFSISAAARNGVNDGGSVGNGGDPIALEFLRGALRVLDDVMIEKNKTPDPFHEVNVWSLNAIIKDTKVTVVDYELWVVIDGKRQLSTAINYPGKNAVDINRARWNNMKSQQEKLSLVFHEILGLAGLETSGNYPISKRYVYKKDNDRADVIISKDALPIIPANAVSCYSAKIAGPGQTPTQDVDNSYFRIPSFTFYRRDSSKDLIINTIRITYALPNSKGQPTEMHKCEIAGDPLRALSSYWWKQGTEAKIPADKNPGSELFTTDCAVYCGGIRTEKENFQVKADVEVFGLERDSEGNEEPVKMTRQINLQWF